MKLLNVVTAFALAALSFAGPGTKPAAAFTPRLAAALAVTLQAVPGSGVDSNGNVTYIAQIVNNSFETARSVRLAASLPADALPISASGACSFGTAGGALTADCGLGNLGAFRSVTVTLVTHPTTIGAKTALVNVTAFNAPGVTAGVSHTLSQVAIADVQVTLDDGPDPAQAGQTLTYQAAVTNLGDDEAQDVTLVLVLPPGVTFLGAAPSAGSCLNPGGLVVCDLRSLGIGRSETVAIKVQPVSAGFIYTTASVSTTVVPDPALTNNSATVRTYVNP